MIIDLKPNRPLPSSRSERLRKARRDAAEAGARVDALLERLRQERMGLRYRTSPQRGRLRFRTQWDARVRK